MPRGGARERTALQKACSRAAQFLRHAKQAKAVAAADNRGAPRTPIRQPVKVTADGQVGTTLIKDLSTSGARLARPASGHVEVDLPDNLGTVGAFFSGLQRNSQVIIMLSHSERLLGQPFAEKRKGAADEAPCRGVA